MSSTVIIWLTPYPPKTSSFGIGYYIRNQFSMYCVIIWLTPLPPNVIICHNLANPPRPPKWWRHLWTTPTLLFHLTTFWRYSLSSLHNVLHYSATYCRNPLNFCWFWLFFPFVWCQWWNVMWYESRASSNMFMTSGFCVSKNWVSKDFGGATRIRSVHLPITSQKC